MPVIYRLHDRLQPWLGQRIHRRAYGLATGYPPLALVSHFVLDALPHYGIPHNMRDTSRFWKVFFYGGRPSDFGAGDLGDPLPSLRYARLRTCGRHVRLFVGRSCDQTSIV